MKWFRLFAAVFLGISAGRQSSAATNNVLLIGFWPPTNEMLRELSPLNPNFKGRNWNNSGYDVYAYFPEFKSPNSGSVGEGYFRVDFASAYNDFMEITSQLKPVVIIGFGQGDGPWEIEKSSPASFADWFTKGEIPSSVNEKVRHKIPESLKQNLDRSSSLPIIPIQWEVNDKLAHLPAYINSTGGPGDYLCGFLSYLIAWYHDEHSDPKAPDQNKAGGFIHVNLSLEDSKAAMEISLKSTLSALNAK